jgi:hypothetical protein
VECPPTNVNLGGIPNHDVTITSGYEFTVVSDRHLEIVPNVPDRDIGIAPNHDRAFMRDRDVTVWWSDKIALLLLTMVMMMMICCRLEGPTAWWWWRRDVMGLFLLSPSLLWRRRSQWRHHVKRVVGELERNWAARCTQENLRSRQLRWWWWWWRRWRRRKW